MCAISPGEILEQNARQQQWVKEREQSLREQNEPSPNVQLQSPTPALTTRFPAQESPCFVIHHIELIGPKAEQFAWALDAANSPDRAIDRCLGSDGINLVMRRIQNEIVQRGFTTTRVVASDQDLSKGTLSLTVVPGMIRRIVASEGSSPRATYWNALPFQAGEVLNLRAIEQGLENFKRLPSVQADIQIAPASGADAQPGDSDLLVSWQQPMPFRFSVGLDNSGTESTGKYQGSLTFSYDNWLTLNDLFYVSLTHNVGQSTEGGTSGYTVYYAIPYDYWLLSWSTSKSSYFQNVAGANQNYRYGGDNKNVEMVLSRLLWRDAQSKTSFSLKGGMRQTQNFIDDVEVGVQRRRTVGWEGHLSHRQYLGQSTLDLDATYKHGTGAWQALAAPEEAFGEGTARMALWTASANWSTPVFSEDLRYSANWRVQWNRTRLVPQDRFSIGGPSTVRGFDGSMTLVGDSGWLIRNDLSLPLNKLALDAIPGEIYLGLDYGHVGGPSSDFLLGNQLAGTALGVRGQYKNLNYDVFAGLPLYQPTGFGPKDVTASFNLNLMF
ncbi:ShlB/FhaC/HecB family hemolysin secretion/activation protein [Chitinibacter bivalviorum]|uniref:ShlB/FhaC/HecB family hemolysin secretion/activation protein n=1 Tax=Chitinibacter bivalviorum TaxID=2739434 RepID=A0A7H9BN08_9NEIS|nr:ShlB/FhaC/HecB family hemolysin secretion/activation protein [Chitinibacter bivalviorum]